MTSERPSWGLGGDGAGPLDHLIGGYKLLLSQIQDILEKNLAGIFPFVRQWLAAWLELDITPGNNGGWWVSREVSNLFLHQEEQWLPICISTPLFWAGLSQSWVFLQSALNPVSHEVPSSQIWHLQPVESPWQHNVRQRRDSHTKVSWITFLFELLRFWSTKII